MWVESARAEMMAVLSQLLEHPEPVDRSRGRVVQHVELAEGESELAVFGRRHYDDRL